MLVESCSGIPAQDVSKFFFSKVYIDFNKFLSQLFFLETPVWSWDQPMCSSRDHPHKSWKVDRYCRPTEFGNQTSYCSTCCQEGIRKNLHLRPKGQGKIIFKSTTKMSPSNAISRKFSRNKSKTVFSTQVCSKINKLEVNEPKPVKVIFDWIYNIIIMLYLSGF